MGAIKKAKKRKAKQREITAKEEKSKAPLPFPPLPHYLSLALGRAACFIAPEDSPSAQRSPAKSCPASHPFPLCSNLLSRTQSSSTKLMQKERGKPVLGSRKGIGAILEVTLQLGAHRPPLECWSQGWDRGTGDSSPAGPNPWLVPASQH